MDRRSRWSHVRRVIITGALCSGCVAATAAQASADPGDEVRRETAEAVARLRADVALTTTQGTDRTPATRRLAITGSADFLDAIGDNEVLAPDLQAMSAFTTDDGFYTVVIRADTNALIDGDFMATYVNTDGNALTGSPTFGGADVAIGLLGRLGADSVGALRWDGVGFTGMNLPSLVSFAGGTTDEVWSASAAELGIAPGTRTTLAFASSFAGTYFDFAPEPGLPAFGFTTGALSPPPPPAAPVATPSPAANPPAGVAGGPATRPLAVRSFALRRLPGAVKMRLSWVFGRERVVWRLQLTTSIDGRRATRFAQGSGRSGARTVLRNVRVPLSWSGRTIRARVDIENGTRTVTRIRSIRP